MNINIDLSGLNKAVDWLKAIKNNVNKMVETVRDTWKKAYHQEVMAYIMGVDVNILEFAPPPRLTPSQAGWGTLFFNVLNAVREKSPITATTARLKSKGIVRLSEWREPHATFSSEPLLALGSLLQSIDHETPAYNKARIFIDVDRMLQFTTLSGKKSEDLVQGEIYEKRKQTKTLEDIIGQTYFLHFGGYTSPNSAIPNKWVPPRPFMTYPWYAKGWVMILMMIQAMDNFMQNLKP